MLSTLLYFLLPEFVLLLQLKDFAFHKQKEFTKYKHCMDFC